MSPDQPRTPRIVPQAPSEWDEAAKDGLAAFPTSFKFVTDGWDSGDRNVRGMNVLGTFAHYPALAKAFMTFNAHVSGASTMAFRDREIAILRLSWVMHSEYELVQHMILGRRAGLTDEEIERLQQGPDAAGWSREDADLVRAVDELHELSRITPDTWTRLAQRYDQSQMLDLIFLVGCYCALALAINSLETPIESGTPSLDEATRRRLLASAATR